MPSSACKKKTCRSEEHTSELQSHDNIVCRLLLEKKKSLPCLTPSPMHLRPPVTLSDSRCSASSPSRAKYHRGDAPSRLAYHICWFFFFNDTATTEIDTRSLHEPRPI